MYLHNICIQFVSDLHKSPSLGPLLGSSLDEHVLPVLESGQSYLSASGDSSGPA